MSEGFDRQNCAYERRLLHLSAQVVLHAAADAKGHFLASVTGSALPIQLLRGQGCVNSNGVPFELGSEPSGRFHPETDTYDKPHITNVAQVSRESSTRLC